ncbi:MAG: hypothetical protein CMK09_09340 [Ponticaulis sp.]|nr:hypothetical protein [Ponticaulis sp.]
MDVGMQLAELCKTGEEAKGLETLYSQDVVSVEALAMGEAGREAVGIEALKGKHDWWFSANVVHSSKVGGPFFFGDDKFALTFAMDATDKASGERSQMTEIGIYTVSDGKIVREEFFYGV